MQKSREDTDVLNAKGFRGTWKTTALTAVQEWMVRVMTDYIKREDALKALREYPVTKLKRAIRRLPSADVAQVRHGRWDSDMSGAWCSVCGEYSEGEWNYCPNCGAKMDGNDKWEE